MAVMVHNGPSLPFDFKFPVQNKSILLKSNLINENDYQLDEQMKIKMQVKSINQFGFGYQFEM